MGRERCSAFITYSYFFIILRLLNALSGSLANLTGLINDNTTTERSKALDGGGGHP